MEPNRPCTAPSLQGRELDGNLRTPQANTTIRRERESLRPYNSSLSIRRKRDEVHGGSRIILPRIFIPKRTIAQILKDPGLKGEYNVPENVYYTKEHEWVRLKGDKCQVGVTDYAQNSLHEIVYVDLPKIGLKVSQMQSIGTVESVK